VREVAPQALGRLRAYSWPGNMKELQSALRQALLRAQGRVLLAEVLPELAQGLDRMGLGDGALEPPAARVPDLETFIRRGLAAGTGGLHEAAHRSVDRNLLPMVLEQTQRNLRQAAQVLGIARQTLRDWLCELGISIQLCLDLGEER
jgi:two-component system nitrogen regulation response regulator GlnG